MPTLHNNKLTQNVTSINMFSVSIEILYWSVFIFECLLLFIQTFSIICSQCTCIWRSEENILKGLQNWIYWRYVSFFPITI